MNRDEDYPKKWLIKRRRLALVAGAHHCPFADAGPINKSSQLADAGVWLQLTAARRSIDNLLERSFRLIYDDFVWFFERVALI